MADDWGTNDDCCENGRSDVEVSKGTSFGGRGRGFLPKEGPKYGFSDRRGRGAFRDRGYDRGRGGRGGFPNRNREYDKRGDDNDECQRSNNSWNNDDDIPRRCPFDNSNVNENDNEEGSERKPVTYIPSELNEEELIANLGISKGINFNNYADIEVKYTGDNIPPIIENFKEANFRQLILENLRKLKFDKPTPIQKHAIPVILARRDLMATAQTGSGKTGAYLLPIIHDLLSNRPDSTGGCCLPSAVIISPTRELATQIYNVARSFSSGSFLNVKIIYGGVSVRYHVSQLRAGCDILIATVGRFKDFLNKRIISLKNVRFVVLDEADRMLDLGFYQDIQEIIQHETISEEKQVLMFSATFSDDVQKTAQKYLNNYIFVTVGIVGGACQDVEQNFLEVQGVEKKNTLVSILDEEQSVDGTLLFVEKKLKADFIASYLCECGYRTTSIHGDRFQEQREAALHDFRTGKMSILVATNVAARGLDISGVAHVINYDLPSTVDEYVHRIGRTGRLGNKGKATSFFDANEEQDRRLASGLVTILKEAKQKVPSFLAERSDGDDYESSGFGGHDYRQNVKNNFKTDPHNQPLVVQELESWD